MGPFCLFTAVLVGLLHNRSVEHGSNEINNLQ